MIRPSTLPALRQRALHACVLAAFAAVPATALAATDNGGSRQNYAGAGGSGSGSSGGGGVGGAGAYYALNFYGYGSAGSGGNGNSGWMGNGPGGPGGAGGTPGLTTSGATTFIGPGTFAGGNGANAPNAGAGGGGGGVAVYLTTAGNVVQGTATLRGGNGGAGGSDAGAGGGGGGGGGSGASLATGATLTSMGGIVGGNGGLSGAGGGAGGGGGGAGVWMSTNTSLVNQGSITGGNGGAPVDTGGGGGGGSGIVANDGQATIVNSGSVAGGLGANGVRAHAFDLYGGNNLLTLSTGTALTGDVYAYSGTNELRLDGSGATASNVSGFDVVSATSNASWSLDGSFQRSGATRFETASGATVRVAGAMTGSGTVTKNGAGTLVLGGNNTYTGTTTLNAGTLALSQSNSARGAYVINGGTLSLAAGKSYLLGNLAGTGGSISGGALLSVRQDTAGTYAGDILGTNTFEKLGAATLTLTGNLAAGAANVVAGTLRIGDNGVAAGTGTNFGLTGTLAINRTHDYALQGSITGSGNVTIAGSGVFTFGGNNSYAGGTSVGAGITVRAASGTAFGTGNVTLGNSDTLDLGLDGMAVANTFTLGGNASINVGNGITARLLSGLANASAGFTKTGAGHLVLDGTNVYTGTTTLNAGTLALSQSNGTRGTYVINGGTLSLAPGKSYLFGNLSGTGGTISGGSLLSVRQDSDATYAGGILATTTFEKLGNATLTLTGPLAAGNANVTAGILRIGDNGVAGGTGTNFNLTGTLAIDRTHDYALQGALSGSGNVALNGTGTFTLSGDNGYSGGTNVGAGIFLRAASSTAFGSGNVTLGDSDTLDFGADGLAIANTFTLGNDARFNVGDGLTGRLLGNLAHGAAGLTKTGTGNLVLDGRATGTGTTTVAQGSLTLGSVPGSTAELGGDVLVRSGATLVGNGRVGGSATIASGALLSAGTGLGTLSIGGDLSMQSGSVVRYDLDAPGPDFRHVGSGDLVAVGGDASFDNVTVRLAPTSRFAAGVYRLLTVGGVARSTNGGLQLSGAPAGSVLSLRYLAADHAIDLVNVQDTTLSFWNANGLASTRAMGGGDGTWSMASTNFTDAVGSVAGVLAPQPGFAIFGGTAGNVTLDGSAGDVTVTGLQVMTDGYRLGGATLTLTGDATLRVGDGSSAGAATTATVDSVIAGTHGLTKSDTGTLVLTADNRWTGGVSVTGGTLSVARDANLGDAANRVALDGGTLRNTAALTTSRAFTVGLPGGALDTRADLTLTGAIDGTGDLHKRGVGTLTIEGNSHNSGTTWIDEGTLVLAGSLGGVVALGDRTILLGAGRVGALTVGDGSTLSPGGDSAMATLGVDGDVVIANGSRYVVSLTPGGASDTIAAGGKAVLQGGTVDARFAGSTLKPATRYTILTAAGGVSGGFAAATSDTPFLTPSLAYGAQAVYLELDRNDVDFAALASNDNARATANAIQSQGIGGALFDPLAVLDRTQVMPALDSLTGVAYASTRGARADDARQVRETVQRHVTALSDERGPANDVWAGTWGHWGDRNSDAQAAAPRVRANGAGLVAGIDRDFDAVRMGAIAGTGTLGVHTAGDSVQTSTTLAGGWLGATTGPWEWTVGATYARQRMEGHRALDMPGIASSRASSRYDGNLAQGWLDAGYRIALAHASLTPFVNVARVHVDQAAFTEHQADAALRVQGAGDSTTVATAGLRGALSLAEGIDAHLKVGYQRAYGDITPVDRQRFLSGGDTFAIQGTPLARKAAVIDMGAAYAIGRHTTVNASYQGLFGADGKDQGMRIDVTVRW